MKSRKNFLDDHRVEGDAILYIHRTGSFRDQVRSARALVNSAVHRKLITSDSTVLVIGGGLTGTATALHAVEKGAQLVVILETEPTLFSLQSRCPTRWLSPYEYAWPKGYYMQRIYPISMDEAACPPPMKWEAGSAARIATRMAAVVMSHAETQSHLTIRLNGDLVNVQAGTLRDSFSPNGEYDVIIVCTGAVENVSVPEFAFKSYAYWDEDPFETLSEIPTNHNPVRVLLSGGGDGGLQETLRIIFPPKPSAWENIKAVGHDLWSRIDKNHEPEPPLFSAGALLNRLLRALNSDPRFDVWKKESLGLCRPARPLPSDLWGSHTKLLEVIKNDRAWWGRVSAALEKAMNPDVLEGRWLVTLAIDGDSFTKCFTLNSLLIHLTDAFLSERARPLLRLNAKVASIKSATPGHTCGSTAKDCCGKTHEVRFGDSVATAGPEEMFEIVILRHNSRQILKIPSEDDAVAKDAQPKPAPEADALLVAST